MLTLSSPTVRKHACSVSHCGLLDVRMFEVQTYRCALVGYLKVHKYFATFLLHFSLLFFVVEVGKTMETSE
jgi:hypothetical protein